VLGFQI